MKKKDEAKMMILQILERWKKEDKKEDNTNLKEKKKRW